MFENCILKYDVDKNGNNICVNVTYPEGSKIKHMSVPLDENNTDYQNILAWVAEGNTIQEAD